MADSEENRALQALQAAVKADIECLGATPLSDKAGTQKLQADIQAKLSQIRAATRDLELLAEELDSEEEHQAVAVLLSSHQAEYARIQGAVKGAAAQQRAAAAAAADAQRRELLSGADAAGRQRQLATEADAVSASEGITDGLRRTRQVLSEELDHTGAVLAAMDASHARLAKTRGEYEGQHGLLRKSRGLLGTLDWQNRSETYLLWFGLTLFVAVAAYIVQKRAGYFVPEALKPGTLLHRAGLWGGRGPVSKPAPVAAAAAGAEAWRASRPTRPVVESAILGSRAASKEGGRPHDAERRLPEWVRSGGAAAMPDMVVGGTPEEEAARRAAWEARMQALLEERTQQQGAAGGDRVENDSLYMVYVDARDVAAAA